MNCEWFDQWFHVDRYDITGNGEPRSIFRQNLFLNLIKFLFFTFLNCSVFCRNSCLNRSMFVFRFVSTFFVFNMVCYVGIDVGILCEVWFIQKYSTTYVFAYSVVLRMWINLQTSDFMLGVTIRQPRFDEKEFLLNAPNRRIFVYEDFAVRSLYSRY